MPKKYRENYEEYSTFKPAYVHPSLLTSKSSASSPPPSSVNDRLSLLRIAQPSPSSQQQKRQLAEQSNQRSLPPSVTHDILGFAPSAAPNPRPGTRPRVRLRTAGPAAPPSWQARSAASVAGSSSSAHGSSSGHGERYYSAGRAPRSFGPRTTNGTQPDRTRPSRLAGFYAATGDEMPSPGSLLDMSLRLTARCWDDVVEDCYDELDCLPVRVRAFLLSYISVYGPDEGVDIRSLSALFPDLEEISALDLGGLAGWRFSIRELRKWLVRRRAPAPAAAAVSPAGPVPPSVPAAELLDSWDQEEAAAPAPQLLPSLTTTSATHLTRLSLAHPPPSASWKDLLALSKHLSTLTHLSLAAWPLPTLTPNLKSAVYVSSGSSGSSGGGGGGATDHALTSESALQLDEAAVLLRQLAENTYCLRWLDVSGCAEWVGALGLRRGREDSSFSSSSSSSTTTTANEDTHEWPSHAHGNAGARRVVRVQGPDWTRAWSKVSHVNIAQHADDTTATNQPPFPSSLDPSFLLTPAFAGRYQQRYSPLLSSTHRQILDDLAHFCHQGGDSHNGLPAQFKTQKQKYKYTWQQSEKQKLHCLPCHAHAPGNMPNRASGAGLYRACNPQCRTCDAFQEAMTGQGARWLEREGVARGVGRGVCGARRVRGETVGGVALGCVFDYGWVVRESYGGS